MESLKEFLQAQAVNASFFFADLLLAHVGIKSPQTQATDHEGRFTVDERDRVKKARWKQVVIPAHYLDLYFNRFHPFLPSRALTCSFWFESIAAVPISHFFTCSSQIDRNERHANGEHWKGGKTNSTNSYATPAPERRPGQTLRFS